MGLLGWREKRSFVSPLSQSSLGLPLVPRNKKGKESVVGLNLPFLTNKPVIPNFRRKQGDKVVRLREEKGRRDERTVH